MNVTDYVWLVPTAPTLWWLWAKIRPHLKVWIKIELNLGAKDEAR